MNNTKKKYTDPEIEVIEFDEDVIATSGGFDPPNTNLEGRYGIGSLEMDIFG